MQGWPDHKSKMPSFLAPNQRYADELTVQNGVIYKGEKVIVLAGMRAEMKKDSSVSSGRNWMFAPGTWISILDDGMTTEIKQMISQCVTCYKYEISESKETLMSHEVPERPWEKVGVGCFLCPCHSMTRAGSWYGKQGVQRTTTPLSP